jgi:hypothetical protein
MAHAMMPVAEDTVREHTMRVSRRTTMTGLVVLVDGIARSGKGLLGPILSSFERVELERMEEIFEYVGGLHRMGKIDTDAAVALLRLEADMHLYNGLIGRNTNFRPGDHSGVWQAPRPWAQVRRLFRAEGQAVLARLRDEQPIFQNMTHDQLMNVALFHDAFGAQLRVVEMIRHPVDLIDSWWRRGWGTRYGEDPYALTLCVDCDGRDVPFYALGWEQAYLDATPMGRIVRMIQGVWEANQRTYARLPAEQRAQICMIPLSHFLEHPWPAVERLAAFLGTAATRRTRRILARKGLPKREDVRARTQRWERLQAQMSAEEQGIVHQLVDGYEQAVRACGVEPERAG